MRVNIIGAGLAGLAAAIRLAERNIPSNLVSVQISERAQSVMAEGGINAAMNVMGEGDTPEEHAADTLRGGVFLADPEAVRGLTEGAPDIVRMLMSRGVPFNMEGERLVQRPFGGQKKRRTTYSKSSTGKALMTAMIDEARKYEGRQITRYSHHRFLHLDIRAGRCAGAVAEDTYTGEILRLPGPVILAFGGPCGLLPGRTTGTTANDASGLAAVFAQGVEAANLEFIQYHPTTVGIAGKRMLISEAARGEGGRLFVRKNGTLWYFMEEKYPELGNLMPRDVVSREMDAVVKRPDCEDTVYLDLTGLPAVTWKKRLPDLRREVIHYLGIDPAKKPVPVKPGIHFFMGGVRVDRAHRASLPGLYAAGECACQYHGANRLGGNSLLGAIYGGMAAANTAAEELPQRGEEEVIREVLTEEELRDTEYSVYLAEPLAQILDGGLGITRTGEGIREALDRLEYLRAKAVTSADRNRFLLAEAMLRCADARKESRGSHQRSDFPERDDAAFRKTTVVCLRDGAIRVGFEEIGAGNGTGEETPGSGAV